MVLFIVWGLMAITAASCTLSYQNISTHGTAQDLVDENQTASPDIKTDATANISAIPKVPGISALK